MSLLKNTLLAASIAIASISQSHAVEQSINESLGSLTIAQLAEKLIEESNQKLIEMTQNYLESVDSRDTELVAPVPHHISTEQYVIVPPPNVGALGFTTLGASFQ